MGGCMSSGVHEPRAPEPAPKVVARPDATAPPRDNPPARPRPPDEQQEPARAPGEAGEPPAPHPASPQPADPDPEPEPEPEPGPEPAQAPVPAPDAGGEPPRVEFEMTDLSELQQQKVVGKGSSGNVFQCVHTPTGVTVCIKQVPISLKEADQESVLQSLRDIYRSRHPNVTAFHGAAYDGHSIVIAFEYMHYRSMKDVLKKLGRLSEDVVGYCCGNVVDGLVYLHKDRHIIHRDIKPSNVLLNEEGSFKISDFGMSKELSDTLSAGQTWVGTSCYMSPERVSGLNYSFNADIWGLGILAYECCAGRGPYQSKGTFELLDAIVDGDAPELPRDTFSEDACDLVAQCLQKEHSQRPDSIRISTHAFIAKHRAFDAKAWLSTIP